MKYFLAVDRGQKFKNNLRFMKINLESINNKLVSDNNLEALCTFTCTFENEAQLKAFLQAKGLLTLKDIENGLTITYFRNYNRFIKIPYASQKHFLNFKKLEEIIYSFSKKPGFLDVIANHYINYPPLANEVYSIKGYISNPYSDYKFYDVVRKFVDKICFREKKVSRKINYKGLYDLGMLISALEEFDKVQTSEITRANTTEESLRERNLAEEDPAYFHLEELKSRKDEELDGQMRLF